MHGFCPRRRHQVAPASVTGHGHMPDACFVSWGDTMRFCAHIGIAVLVVALGIGRAPRGYAVQAIDCTISPTDANNTTGAKLTLNPE